jgi:CRISPR-associated protein Cas6
MHWQETKPDKPYVVPDDVVDLGFRLNCKALPLEHAHALSEAIISELPWLRDEEQAGIHLIHGAESGNGWLRPEDVENELLYLSRRTRMYLRLPQERLQEAMLLVGKELDISGHALLVGETSIRKLSMSSTIFSRYVVTGENESEEDFIQRLVKEIQGLGVNVNKMLCGRSHVFQLPERKIHTRSVMLAELSPQHSVTMQQHGLGEGRKHGCGLFIAHKGIAPVKEADDE